MCSIQDRATVQATLASVVGAILILWAGGGIALAGSFLARCPAASDHDRLAVAATEPSEPNCVSRVLPLKADAVLAVLPAPRRTAGAPEPQTVTIVGASAKDAFEAREVTVMPASLGISAPYLVPGADLRAVSSVALLGPLGRATLDRSGDDTILDCAPGTQPAGIAFSTARLPPIP